jgi:hypothetical protein
MLRSDLPMTILSSLQFGFEILEAYPRWIVVVAMYREDRNSDIHIQILVVDMIERSTGR